MVKNYGGAKDVKNHESEDASVVLVDNRNKVDTGRKTDFPRDQRHGRSPYRGRGDRTYHRHDRRRSKSRSKRRSKVDVLPLNVFGYCKGSFYFRTH